MSADPAAGNRPHTRPEFDQIRFNCAAGRSPNVLEMHILYVYIYCVCTNARVYVEGCVARVTRYDAVSRDNAGMQEGRRNARATG